MPPILPRFYTHVSLYVICDMKSPLTGLEFWLNFLEHKLHNMVNFETENHLKNLITPFPAQYDII